LNEKRKKIWIDRLQTSLFVRIIGYFVCYQIAVWSAVLLADDITKGIGLLLGPQVAGFCLAFLVSVVSVVGLLFAWDAVKYAHRVVGPLARLRHTIKAITAGEEVGLLAFRTGDLLGELKDEVNDMLRGLEQRGAVTLRPAPGHDQTQPLSV
jgi:hypothetical protein